MLCAACGFTGASGRDPDPDPSPGEKDVVLDTAADFAAGAFNDSFVQGTGNTATVEPTAWQSKKLLAELDDLAGPYDGTWGSRPPQSSLVGRGLMTPPFLNNKPPPGAASGGFVAWFAGEVRLDAGVQRVALAVSAGALSFLDILRGDGTVLVHCTAAQIECSVNAPSARWYSIRIGWNRPNGVANDFQLKWATGAAAVADLDPTRLRIRVHTGELAGSRIEGFDTQRSINGVANAVALDAIKPIDLTWTESMFGLNTGNPSYRNLAQLRIAEGGSYNLELDANPKASYRLWMDGEWVSQPSAFNPTLADPPPESFARELSAGWHDVVLEGYEQGGTVGNVGFKIGKVGQVLATPALADTRPMVARGPLIAEEGNAIPIALARNAPVARTLTVSSLATVPPRAEAIDVSLRLKPVQWTGLQVRVTPPGAAIGIPLTIDVGGLTANVVGEVHGSLKKSLLGSVAAQGDWKVDIIHPDVDGLDGTNTVTLVRLNVHYAGGPGVAGSAPSIAETATYSRMITLDNVHELRGLLVQSTAPVGTEIAVTAQVCGDAAGASCQAAVPAEQLASSKPKAQFVKLLVTFTSDGFAVPMLDKLTLRYLE
jgi:hypothetical protein